MPTTLSGFLLFVVLLLPGFAYQVGKERRGTERTTSVLRETAAVVAASVASEVFVVAVTAWLWSQYVDFGRLVREPRKYWLCAPATLAWWAMALLAGACVLAYLATQLRGRKVPDWGHRAAKKLKKRRPLFVAVRWIWRRLTYVHPSTLSAWGTLFQEAQRSQVQLDITLTNGAYVQGMLMTYSTVGADTPDRDLVLGPPIKYRNPGSKITHDFPAGAVVVSARQMATMFVTREQSS